MQKTGPSQQQGANDSSPSARDAAVPGFVVSSLVAGLPFLGLMMIVSIVSGQEQVGRLVSLLVTLLVEGLCIAFFWRRVEPTAGKNFSVAAYAVGLWAFMAGCLVTTFGLRFGGAIDLARNVALLGSGVVAISSFFFAIVWAQSQAPRLMVQTHSMIATSVVLAGFTALLLKGGNPGTEEQGETLSAHRHTQNEPDSGENKGHGESKDGEHHASQAHDSAHNAASSGGQKASHGENAHGNPAEHHGASDGEALSQAHHNGPASDQNSHGGHKKEAGLEHSGGDEYHQDGEEHAATAHSDRGEDESSAAHTHEWSYEGTTGPETWGKIKPTWNQCLAGREQSPIEISKGSKESRRMISLSYEDNTATLASNGEFLQVLLGRGSHAIINGKAYELKRLEFHSPSEHELSGVSYPMEIQFVHMDTKGRTAIISAFVEKGPVNQELGKIMTILPVKTGATKPLKNALQLARILPREVTTLAHQYKGSLTVPPCSEGVLWSVLKTPLRMSGDQLAAFRAQYAGSNRPVQPLGKRVIGSLESSVGH